MSRRTFHGWKVVSAGAVVSALQSALFNQSFSSYAVVWEQAFGWSKTTLSSVYSMTAMQGGFGGPLVGWALDRFDNRKLVRIGMLVMSAGLLLMSRIQTESNLFVAAFVAAAGLTMSGFLSITTITVRWFERRRAKALSLSATGFAFGGFLVPVVVFFVENVGWRETLAGSAIILAAATFPLTTSFAGTPESHGVEVDGFTSAAERDAVPLAEGAGGESFTLAEALRTRAFWMLSLGHMSALFVVVAVIAHLSLFLVNDHGYSLQKASFVGGALPLIQLVGMLIGGALGDKYNKRYLAMGAMIGHAIAILLLAYARGEWMIWIFVPIHGLAWGVRGPLMQALRADYFGTANFGQIMGVSSLILTLGSAGGPMLVGILADRTGSYRLGFTIIATIAAAGVMFFVFGSPPPPPERHAASRSTPVDSVDG